MSLKTTEIEQETARPAQSSDEPESTPLSPASLATEDGRLYSVCQSSAKNFGALLRHELNNPLTGILGNAELLLVELRRHDVDLPASIQQRLEIIASLAVRMRELVRTLSDRWEAESAQARPRADSVDSSLFH